MSQVDGISLTDKEQQLFDSCGGGEKGAQAVRNRREYLKDYAYMEKQYAKERARDRYYPNNEKESVTHSILFDEDY